LTFCWVLTHKDQGDLRIYHTYFGSNFITFFKRGPVDPSHQCKRASNSIQDPQPLWILTIFKLKFGGGNLFSPIISSTVERNNFLGSLLEPLLKKVTLVVGSRMLCTLESAINILHILHYSPYILYYSPYIVWTRLFLETYTN
jgi:hypothetical protein